jgi:hypothetical protein
MKLSTKKYLLLVISSLIIISGCSKFLEEPDRSNFTKENYFKKPEHAESIINSIYEDMRNVLGGGFNGGPWMMLEFASGLANTELGQAQNSIFVRNLVNNSDNAYGQTYWTNFYRGIANANLAISKIPDIKMDENVKKKLLGEARYLRAMYYYDLVRIFGSIPLISEPVDLGSKNLYPEPASIDNIYKLIESDLLEAEKSGLPFKDPSGRVSLGAVKSLLASVYLTMAGFPLNKPEYFAKSAEKALEVINSNQYTLFTSYDDLHLASRKNSGEFIFQVQYLENILPSNWQTSIIPYNQGISNYTDETGAIFANKEFIESYEKGDKRAAEKQFYYSSYTLRGDRNQSKNLGGYYLFKHFDVLAQTSTTSSGLNWTLLRYPEVLLIYAEAANEVSGPTPTILNAINLIRKRADLPSLNGFSKDDLRIAIWKERWYELSFENKTWYDMVRLRKAFNVFTKTFEPFVGHKFSYGPTLSEKELLFPIPTAEIRNNNKLKQNKGY